MSDPSPQRPSRSLNLPPHVVPPPVPPALNDPARLAPPVPPAPAQSSESDDPRYSDDSSLFTNLKVLLSNYFRWKNVRLRTRVLVAGITLSAIWVLLKFLILPSLASMAVATAAEDYGVSLTVGGWSSDVVDLKAVAHDVAIEVPGPYSRSELLTMDQMEVDLSWWRRIRHGRWTREIRIHEPRLYLERSLSNRWNWQDVSRPQVDLPIAQPPGGGIQTASIVPVPAVEEPDFEWPRIQIENMTLEWLENLPGASGGGEVITHQASLFIDDLNVTLQNVRGIVDDRPLPSSIIIEGRTSDGRLSANLDANLFYWATLPPRASTSGAAAGFQTASRGPEWIPALNGEIYLENIGARTLTRLVPNATLLPTSGSLTGRVEFALNAHQVECFANLQLVGMSFQANSSSALGAKKSAQLNRHLADFIVSGPQQFTCGGDLLLEEYRPLQYFESQVARSAVQTAHPSVRAAAEVDWGRYTTEPTNPSLSHEINRFLSGVDPELVDFIVRVAPSPGGGLPSPGTVLRNIPGVRLP